MANEIQVKQRLDYNKLYGLNWVLPQQTRTSVTSPVDGQVVIDEHKPYYYDNSTSKWVVLGGGAVKIQGTVGTDAAHTEWLANLPDEPSLQDAYYVGSAGSYGSTGSTQHGDIGDLFICITEKTTSAAAVWTLVPSGNGRFTGTITGDGTAESYTLTHPLATDQLHVQMYDASKNVVMANIQVSDTNIIVTFGYSVPTTEVYTLVIIAG